MVARYRAGLLRDALARVRDDEQVDGEAIVQRIPTSTLEQIDNAARTDWLDASVMLDIDEAIEAVEGRAAYHAFWRRFPVSAIDLPLLRPLATGLMRVFTSGAGLVKLLPRTFGLVTKDMATFEVDLDASARSAEFYLRGLALEDRIELFAIANVASIEGMFDLLGGDAVVDWSYDEVSRDLLLTIRW